MRFFHCNQKGAIPVLMLLAVVGLVAFLALSTTLPFKDKLLTSLFPKDASQAAGVPWNGVPDLPINYTQDALTWWNAHPFNPQSPNYRPDITSPSNQFNVQTQYGGNIQAAIEAAAAAGGGTLIFPAGTYGGTFQLIGKSNIHFIGQGTVVINMSDSAVIAGCQTSVVYADISAKVAQKDPAAVACVTTARAKNIYFKNIIFDGGGTLLQSMALSATKDLLFDNVTFRNFSDPKTHHRGLVSGNAVLDNIWFRNSKFEGNERYVLYLDGAHGSGVIDSTITGQYSGGGILLLTNDDLSRDYNNSGTIDINEQRTANHVVVANNTFSTPIYGATSATGRDILVINNTFNSGITTVADFDAKSSHVENALVYNYFGNMVINNKTQGLKWLMEISGSADCPNTVNCAKQGRYTVMGNKTLNASGYISPVNEVNTSFGTIEGPRNVSGNCVNDPSCVPVGPVSVSSTAPAASPTPVASTAPVNTGSAEFPIGVFEDGNMFWGRTADMTNAINDLQSKGLNAMMFVNNDVINRDDAMFSVADQKNFNVYVSANAQFNSYLHTDTTPTIEEARNIVYPVVDKYKTHSSVKGYNVSDEPHATAGTGHIAQIDQIKHLVQAFKERDGTKPASPVLIGINRGDTIYDAAKPNAFFMDIYPFSVQSASCDFTMKGFGYTQFNMSSYIRQMTRNKPVNDPLYVILQTHNVGDAGWGMSQLRIPSIPEIRGQHWIAIGEGAEGIFWFIYSSQQGWTGLKDSPSLMAEIGALAQRTNPLKPILLDANRHTTDLFTVNNGAYVSTLTSKDGTKKYAVVANTGSCGGSQNLTISSSQTGQLKDLESGQTYNIGQAISFPAGDGKIFELVGVGTSSPVPSPSAVASVAPTTSTNLLTNGSFEQGATGWSLNTSTIDTTGGQSGNNSLKAVGPADVYTRQNIDLKPNTSYTLSYWIKTNNITGIGATMRYVQLLPATSILLQPPAVPYVTGTSQWTKYTGTFTTPANYTGGRLDAQYKLLAGDTAWFDNVELCEGSCVVPNSPVPTGTVKVGDVDGNGKVDIFDYNELLTNFGKSGANIRGDINNNGKVDIFDFNDLLTNFGK